MPCKQSFQRLHHRLCNRQTVEKRNRECPSGWASDTCTVCRGLSMPSPWLIQPPNCGNIIKDAHPDGAEMRIQCAEGFQRLRHRLCNCPAVRIFKDAIRMSQRYSYSVYSDFHSPPARTPHFFVLCKQGRDGKGASRRHRWG